MDAAWLLVVLAVAVLVSLVVLAVTCLHCRDRGPLSFRVIHQSQHTIDPSSTHRSSNHPLPPFSPSVDAVTQQRPRPFTAAETDSNPSYENPANGSGYVNDSDAESNGYIIVVPGEEANQSGASTPSSHNYVNVPEKKDDREYQNVDPQESLESTSEQSAQSDSDSDSDSDNGDMGNYVNVLDATVTD